MPCPLTGILTMIVQSHLVDSVGFVPRMRLVSVSFASFAEIHRWDLEWRKIRIKCQHFGNFRIFKCSENEVVISNFERNTVCFDLYNSIVHAEWADDT